MTKPKPKQKSAPNLNTRRIKRLNKGLEWAGIVLVWSVIGFFAVVFVIFIVERIFGFDHILTQLLLWVWGGTMAGAVVSMFALILLGMAWLFEHGIQWTERPNTNKRKR